MGIALILLMAGFIKICSVHTPSSNPKLPPPKPLPGIERRAFAGKWCLLCDFTRFYSDEEKKFWTHFVHCVCVLGIATESPKFAVHQSLIFIAMLHVHFFIPAQEFTC